MNRSGSRVVKHSTYNPKTEGSNPAADPGRMEMTEKFRFSFEA